MHIAANGIIYSLSWLSNVPLYTYLCVTPSLHIPLSMASLASDRTSATSPSTVGCVKCVAPSLAVFKDVSWSLPFRALTSTCIIAGSCVCSALGCRPEGSVCSCFLQIWEALASSPTNAASIPHFPLSFQELMPPLLDSSTSPPKVSEAFPSSFHSFCPFFRLPHFYWPISRLTGLLLCWLPAAIEPIWLVFQFAS